MANVTMPLVPPENSVPADIKGIKTKIIHIKPHLAPYGSLIRPLAVFTTARGSQVGMWDYPRERTLCETLCQLDKRFEFELWQPDVRTDRIHVYTWKSGFLHKLFPARTNNVMVAERLKLSSTPMIRELKKYIAEYKVIIHLHGYLFGINKQILRSIPASVPIIFSFRGEISMPRQHLWHKKYISKIKCITYMTDTRLDELKKIYGGRLEKITMGCDFSVFRKKDKSACRLQLGLPQDAFIIITIFWLGHHIKQVDKFIDVLNELRQQYNFLYIIVGGCDSNIGYVDFLKRKAQPLLECNKIVFTGPIFDKETIATYINSADLYVHTAVSEGGPIVIMEALACEIPVFSTMTGNAAELLDFYQCGCLVGKQDYSAWREKIEEILQGALPRVLERRIAQAHYDWPSVARRFLAIYESL